MRDMESLPPPPLPPRPDPPVEPHRRTARPWIVAVAVVLILSVAVAAVIPFTSRGEPRVGEGFSFLARAYGGGPVRWNPCTQIHYVVNAALAPTGSMEDVHGAIGRISSATGITFAYDGLSDERPS